MNKFILGCVTSLIIRHEKKNIYNKIVLFCGLNCWFPSLSLSPFFTHSFVLTSLAHRFGPVRCFSPQRLSPHRCVVDFKFMSNDENKCKLSYEKVCVNILRGYVWWNQQWKEMTKFLATRMTIDKKRKRMYVVL